jgi:hypothetical protein
VDLPEVTCAVIAATMATPDDRRRRTLDTVHG